MLSRAEASFEDLVLLEWHHISATSGAIFKRVMIRSELSLLMANYIKIKRVKSMQSHITIAREGSWVLEELSASKVRWLELSQLSLCSEFDKENSMEFSLISLLLIHFTTVAMHLLSHGPHVTLIMWPSVTVTCDRGHTIVTLWQSHMILSRAPSCSCK